MTDDETTCRPGPRAAWLGIVGFVIQGLLAGTAQAVVSWLLDCV